MSGPVLSMPGEIFNRIRPYLSRISVYAAARHDLTLRTLIVEMRKMLAPS